MDAVERLNENFLSCNICTERFNEPCTLVCGHTFCRACLVSYTKTRQDAIRAKSILCPNCRQMTKVPNPHQEVEDWAKQIKPHFLIRGLLDEFAAYGDSVQETAVPTGRLCFSCQQIRKTVEAECLCQDCDVTLCEDCVKRHTTLPGTKYHTIADMKGEVKVKGKSIVVCKEHGSAVELCCEDCNKVICHKCCNFYHRKCQSVVSIESMVKKMKQVIVANKRDVEFAVEKLQTNLAGQQMKLDQIQVSKALIQSEIKSISQQAMNLIKRKKKQLMDELDELTEKQTGQLRAQIKPRETDLQTYQQYLEFMDQALTSESVMDLYNVYQMCQSGAVSCAFTTEMDISATLAVTKVTFEDRLKLQTFGVNFELGRLRTHYAAPDLTKKPVLFDTVNTKTVGESMDSRPLDVTVLNVDDIDVAVVVDEGNNCVKSFFTKHNQALSSTLTLQYEPSTVIHLKDNLVAVTHSTSVITVVKVTPDLAVHSRIPTRKKYRCLTVLDTNTLAAGCKDPPSIDILNLSGRVYRSLTPRETGLNLIKAPWFLCTTNKGHILVSDAGSDSVYCLKQEEDVVFIYHPEEDKALSGPRGITSTLSGDILVVDRWNRRVILLTERGELVKYVLTSHHGLEKPLGIFVLGERLYMTEYSKGTVKVFLFQ